MSPLLIEAPTDAQLGFIAKLCQEQGWEPPPAVHSKTEASPYPKRSQLHRPARRAKRVVATKAQWAVIAAAKLGPCRVCCDPGHNGSQFGKIQLHHLVPRSQLGDDVADNIVPLCPLCHLYVTDNVKWFKARLAESLTDAEYAYCIGKLGEGAIERLFGVAP